MNNHLYIQVNENTDITSGQWSDGSVFIAINQKDKIYHIYDINNSGEQNQRELGTYLHFRNTDDIDNLINLLQHIKCRLRYTMLSSQNDEYSYGHNITSKTCENE